MSHNKRKQATKAPRNKHHGSFSVNTAEETKAKAHVFRQREISSTHVGPERRTSTCFPPIMRSGLFGFSLILWRSRRRPRCRCFKSLSCACSETAQVWLRASGVFLSSFFKSSSPLVSLFLRCILSRTRRESCKLRHLV